MTWKKKKGGKKNWWTEQGKGGAEGNPNFIGKGGGDGDQYQQQLYGQEWNQDSSWQSILDAANTIVAKGKSRPSSLLKQIKFSPPKKGGETTDHFTFTENLF